MEDITEFLAFEVKKEMADRYFGFRKRIEDDSAAYTQRLALSSLDLENRIGFSLIRLYILLHRERLIFSFIDLVGLPKEFFYDPYIIASPTIRKRLFAGKKCHGLSWKRRFFNMFYDSYQQLAEEIDTYHDVLSELTEEQETIREQINLFYRKNDIDSIMSFIRRLETPDTGMAEMMQTGAVVAPGQSLEGKLRLHPPLPACEVLPDIPALPELKAIMPQLKRLLQAALPNAETLDLRALTR